MRFMLLVKSDERTEAGAMPDEKFMAAMGKYNEDLAKAGKLLAAEGLHPSSKGARLKIAGGERTLTKGPFGAPESLVAGYWIIQADSKDEAIEWAKRVPFEADEDWVASGGIGQIEVRQVSELDDFPVNENESGWREQEAEIRAASADGISFTVPQPAPDGPPLKRFFCVANADNDYEECKPISEEVLAAIGEFMREMAAAGVLLGGEGLQPTSKGARVTFSGRTKIVTDGPFMETKEVVGGFGIIQAKSLDEAIELSWRFLEVGCEAPDGENSCEIRQIFDASDFPA